MATFAQIKTEVQGLLIDLPAATAANIGTYVNRALRTACSQHNFQCMEEMLRASTTIDTRKLEDVPSTWKEPRDRPYIRDGQDGELGNRELDWAASENDMARLFTFGGETDVGDPRYLLLRTVEGSTDGSQEIYVFPLPDGASEWDDGEYRVVIPYYRYLPDLSADADTNWLTNHPNGAAYLVYQAAAYGFLSNWDEARASVYERMAASEFAKLVREDRRRQTSKIDTLAILRGPYQPRG